MSTRGFALWGCQVVVAIFAGSIGIADASTPHRRLFRAEVQASEADCDCSCYGERVNVTSASGNSFCSCPGDSWQACQYGFGIHPLVEGPSFSEAEAACCPYDWNFLKDKSAVSLVTTAAKPIRGRMVAKIDASLNFVIRWSMMLGSFAQGNVFHFVQPDASSDAATNTPALDVLADGKLNLRFGDYQRTNRATTSTLKLTKGKMYHFELNVGDCSSPSCLSLKDSNGQLWLQSSNPMSFRAAWKNVSVYFSSPFRVAATVTVRNFMYTSLPFNAILLSGFPLIPVDNKPIAKFDGTLNYHVTFDITVLEATTVGNAFMFKGQQDTGAAYGPLVVGIERTKLSIIVGTADKEKDRAQTTNLQLNRNYQFELIVQDGLVQLFQKASPSIQRLLWLSFDSPPSKRLVRKHMDAYMCAGTHANVVIGNLMYFKH